MRERLDQIRVVKDLPAGAPLEHLVEIGRFGKGAELLGQTLAMAVVRRQDDLKRRADLYPADLDAQSSESGKRRFRVFIFHGEVTGVITDLNVIEHGPAGGVFVDCQLSRQLRNPEGQQPLLEKLGGF